MAVARSILVALLLLLGAAFPADASSDEPVVLIVFWGQGCPHCAEEWEYLEDLGEEFPDLEITGYEVRYNPDNWEVFVTTMEAFGMEPRAVPTTILGDQVWEGFSDSIGTSIRDAVSAALAEQEPAPPRSGEVIDLPIFGEVETGEVPLAVSTALIALVDGVNPCSLWVLSILLALVLRTGSRRRVLLIGGTFLTVTALLYAFYIAGMYGILSTLSGQAWVRVLMAVVAFGFGAVSLKEYFRFGTGLSLGIPEREKSRLYRRIRSVTVDSRSLTAALAGTVMLAVGVSILETPCTAGYPLLWANLLSEQQVGVAGALPLYLLYMAIFLVDELVAFAVAVVAMRATKLEERTGRVLRLVAGMVMVALAATLLIAPEAMTSVAGSVMVFAVALGLVLVVLASSWLRRRVTSDRDDSVDSRERRESRSSPLS